jgi:hypothetical protein
MASVDAASEAVGFAEEYFLPDGVAAIRAAVPANNEISIQNTFPRLK